MHNRGTNMKKLSYISLCIILLTLSLLSVTWYSSIYYKKAIIIFIIECLILLIQVLYYVKNQKLNSSLILEKQKYDTVMKHSHGVIWEYDIATDQLKKSDKDSGVYTGSYCITSFSKYPLEHNIIHPEDHLLFKDFIRSLRDGTKDIHTRFRALDNTLSYVWFDFSGVTLYKDHIPVTVIGKTTNIDSQQKEYELLKQHAQEDPLTKLYNRSTASSKINSIINTTELSHMHAFCMIDIDNFKALNDSLGHTFGDAVLIEFSAKLNNLLNNDDFAFRIGGDEFAVFLNDIPSVEYVEKVAAKICGIFNELLLGDNKPCDISGSIGISLYPNHGSTFEELFQSADIALYHSKDLGKDCYSLYSKEKMGQLPISPDKHKEAKLRDSHALLDNTLLSNIIDVLFDAKDLSFTINFILSLIGSYYNLDCVGVCEYSSDYKNILNTYEWRSQGTNVANDLINISVQDAEEYAFYKNKSGVFYCRDISTLETTSKIFIDYLKKQNTQSFIQCAIADSGNYTGYIYANISKNSRQLEKHEIDTISFVSKIIGGYIRKLRSEEMARTVARKDLLTDSYNINSFSEEFMKILESNHYDQFALINLDINKFKQINETFGYSHGDKLLKAVALMIKENLQPNELLGRIFADRFLLLLHYDTKEDLEARIINIMQQFDILLENMDEHSNPSIILGIYLIEQNDGFTMSFDRSNIARKSILERHKNNYAYFDKSMKSSILRKQHIENIMVSSLMNKEFTVYYQPKFNLITGEICGAEALIRWIREDGIIYPSDFIPIFEENGFITEIDYYVLEEVCIQLRQLIDSNHNVLPISVNLSRYHFRDNQLVSHIRTILDKYNISPYLIEFELTESAMTDTNHFLLSTLEELRNLGFKLSMDDFGSGLSSLNALRILPFDILKLDKNFFKSGDTTKKERIVISNIVNMARELNMEIISEGVETKEQADFLKSIGCEYAQGYLFAKPMPADDFTQTYL